MATYYVSFVDGTDGNTGADWANAVKTLKYAVETLAAGAGQHTIKWDSASAETVAADTTITLARDIYIVSVDRANSDALLAGATIGSQTTNYSLTLAGAFELYVYGVTFQTGTNTSVAESLQLDSTDGSHYEFEGCTFNLNTTSAGRINIGGTGGNQNRYVKMKSSTLKFSHASQGLNLSSVMLDLENVTISASGTAPTTLFQNGAVGVRVSAIACDWSHVSGTLVGDVTGAGTQTFNFANLKLHASVTIKAAATSVLNKGQTTVTAIDCQSGDTHYALYHGDAFGETTAVSDYYYTTGGASIGSGFSWKIVTTVNCSFWNPYVSPWFHRPHTGTSAISVSLEGLRLSTTVIQDDEVWGEFSYKGTSGSVITTLVNDRQDVGARANGTAGSNQTSSAATSDWTNGTGSHSTFKLAPASTITPAEVGVLSARVIVGEPNLTVYVDPNIRVA